MEQGSHGGGQQPGGHGEGQQGGFGDESGMQGGPQKPCAPQAVIGPYGPMGP